MKNFENFSLSNAGKRFLIEIILITLFFALVGISKLAAQDSKDPLGYDLRFGKDNKVYLVYDIIIRESSYFPSEHKNTIIVDSFYVHGLNELNLSVSPFVEKKIISRVYHCSQGKELFVYSKTNKERSQENWPSIENVTFNVYGKMIGSTVHLRKELKREPLRKGWTGPICLFCIIGLFFIRASWKKYADMRSWRKFKRSTELSVVALFCISSIFPFFYWINSSHKDYVGGIIYVIIFLSMAIINLLVNTTYKILLRRHNKRASIEALRKDKKYL
ncbi:MAG: hypothetical protein ABIE36_01755 [Candidatus Diapherotrites archaeon]